MQNGQFLISFYSKPFSQKFDTNIRTNLALSANLFEIYVFINVFFRNHASDIRNILRGYSIWDIGFRISVLFRNHTSDIRNILRRVKKNVGEVQTSPTLGVKFFVYFIVSQT